MHKEDEEYVFDIIQKILLYLAKNSVLCYLTDDIIVLQKSF